MVILKMLHIFQDIHFLQPMLEHSKSIDFKNANFLLEIIQITLQPVIT